MKNLATAWSVIEARCSFPAVILVTSATAEDGTAEVAQGLETESKNSGRRTNKIASLSPYGTSRAFNAALHEQRGLYDVVIVEVPQLLSADLGAHVANMADGIIVAVCKERRILPVDHEASKLFRQLNAPLLGIVATKSVVKAIETVTARAPKATPSLSAH